MEVLHETELIWRALSSADYSVVPFSHLYTTQSLSLIYNCRAILHLRFVP